MIALHRITQPEEEFHLNPDLIQAVEAHPDTVVSLVNGSRFVVIETPQEIAGLVRAWRASILTTAVSAPEVLDSPDAREALSNVLQFPAERSHIERQQQQ